MQKRWKIFTSIVIGSISPIFIGTLATICSINDQSPWWIGPLTFFTNLWMLGPASIIAGLPALLYSVIMTRLAIIYANRGYACWIWYRDFVAIGTILGAAAPFFFIIWKSKYSSWAEILDYCLQFLIPGAIAGAICSVLFIWIWKRKAQQSVPGYPPQGVGSPEP